MPRFLLVLCLLLGTSWAVSAQSLDALRGSAGAFFSHAESSDITVTVKLWGPVQYPGLHEVRQGTPLSILLTLAGGPIAVGQREPQSTLTLTVRLLRPQPDGTDAVVFEHQMENRIEPLPEDPVLLNGDLVVIEEEYRRGFGWRDALSIVTAVSALVLVVERIANFGN